MEPARLVFVELIECLSHLVVTTPRYTRKDLASLASYFWERSTPNYKNYWKSLAKQKRDEGTAKRLRGFWLFALTLERSLHDGNVQHFDEIWSNLAEEEKQYWCDKIDSVVRYEIERKLFKF